MPDPAEETKRTPRDVNPWDERSTLDLTDEQELRLRNQVLLEYIHDREQREAWATEMAALTAQWLSGRGPERKLKPFPGSSNVDIPMTQVAVEGLHAALSSGFNQKPFVRFEETKRLQSYVQWEHEKELEAAMVWDQLHLNTAIYGTGIGRLFPYKGRLLEKDNQDRIRFENVSNIDDFFIPFRAMGPDPIQEAPHIGLRTYPYVYELLQRKKAGVFKNVSVDDGLEYPMPPDESKSNQTKEEFQKQSKPISSNKVNRVVTMLEWYTKFQMDPDENPDEPPIDVVVWLAVSPRQVFYRAAKNPRNFRPFFHCILRPIPGQFWGMGLPKILAQLQEQINTTYNLRNDSVLMAMMPWGSYVPGLGYEPEQMKIAPGVLVPVAESGAIEWQRVPAPPDHAFRETGEIWEVAEKLTGVGPLVLGQGVGNAATATGARAVLQQGSLRLDVAMKRIGIGMASMVKILIRWNKILRGRKGITLRIAGTQDLIEFTEDDFNCDLIPSFEVNSLTGNRQAEREIALLLWDRLMANPIYAQDPRALQLAIEWMSGLFGITPDRLIPDYWKKNQQEQALTNAAEENMRLFQGEFLEASVYDDHGPEAHIAAWKASATVSPETEDHFRLHIQHHEEIAAQARAAGMPVPGQQQTVVAGPGAPGSAPPGGGAQGPGPPPVSPAGPAAGSAESIGNFFPPAIRKLGETLPSRRERATA